MRPSFWIELGAPHCRPWLAKRVHCCATRLRMLTQKFPLRVYLAAHSLRCGSSRESWSWVADGRWRRSVAIHHRALKLERNPWSRAAAGEMMQRKLDAPKARRKKKGDYNAVAASKWRGIGRDEDGRPRTLGRAGNFWLDRVAWASRNCDKSASRACLKVGAVRAVPRGRLKRWVDCALMGERECRLGAARVVTR